MLLGQAGGTLASAANYSTGVITVSYAASIGDVNGDGRPDLVVGNLVDSPIGVLLGQPSGFGPITTFTGGNGPQGITLTDVNADGKPDILTANRTDNTLGVLLNTTASPTLASISPNPAPVGTSVTLTGTNLGGTTAVSFNGTAATTFAIVNGTTITATVPTGATTGNVTVTTSGGTSGGVAFTVTSAPTVTTAAATSLTSTSAVLGGTVTADGGATVTERGVVYSSTNTAPTIGGTGVTTDRNGMGTGAFSKTIAGLASGTTYYARAYATNGVGTSYGSVVRFATQPLKASAQPVTVQLDANGNGTLSASSVNNGSTGSGTLTYTIQKIVYGRVAEGDALTLATPNGANFTAIRFASYGVNTGSNGNYAIDPNENCNSPLSVPAAQNAYVGRSTGTLYAINNDTRNNPVLGDPCDGTPKALAVQAAYSADAASLSYDCTEAGKTQYVLLTVTNGATTSTSVAQVTVAAPPTATLSSVSPTAAQRGATVTVAGTNLSGVSSVTVNGATATVSSLSSTGFTFVVPGTATFGTGSLMVATPCAQTLTSPFTVVAPAPTITAFNPPSGPVGTPVTIAGTNLTGTTAVRFNGTPASSFVVNSANSITAVVAAGTTTGPISVTTPDGTATSSTSFVVRVAPTTVADNYTTPQGVTLTGNVLSNDLGTSPRAILITRPSNGTLVLNPNGSFTYVPNAGFSGTDSFTYYACDPNMPLLCGNPATVTITVTRVAPTTVADAYTTPQGVTLTGNVLTNDLGTNPRAILLNRPANGSLVLNPNGSFTYVPNAGFTGTDSFTYYACDPNLPLLCGNPATVTISVLRIAPVTVADSYTTPAGVTLTGNVLTNDLGTNPRAILITRTTNGTLVLNPDGSFRYVPNAGFVGTDSFTYYACDPAMPLLCGNPATVTITVTRVAPVTVADSYSTPQGVTLTGNVLTNDLGTNPRAILINRPTRGTLVLNPDGSFSYVPNAGFSGLDSFTYYACNMGAPLVCGDPATVSITVRPTNTATRPAALAQPAAPAASAAKPAASAVGGATIALELALAGHPNPFADELQLSFTLPIAQAYTLAVYDAQGRLVQQLASGQAEAGQARQLAVPTRTYAAGLYLVRLTTSTGTRQLKLLKQ